VRELLLLGEGLAAPKLDTLGVDGGKECTLGGPLNEKLCPVSAIHDILWWVCLVVPEHANLVATVKGELITGVAISHPRAQVLLLLERFRSDWLVFFIDTTFTTITLDIHQLVDSHNVLLIERDAVQLLDGGNCHFRGFIFHKSEPISPQQKLEIVHDSSLSHWISNTHPSVIFLSLTGMKTASSEVLPTELSFLNKNLTSFCRLSSGTTGRPSMTINVSSPSSTFTSYCSLRSVD
jgi:hypothetical protein